MDLEEKLIESNVQEEDDETEMMSDMRESGFKPDCQHVEMSKQNGIDDDRFHVIQNDCVIEERFIGFMKGRTNEW